LFPGVLVPLVGLKGCAGHHSGRGGGVQVGLDALPQGMELLARQLQFAGQAGRRLAFGDRAQQQHPRAGGCRVLAKTVPVHNVS
jgi:hypothetical protein